MAVLVKITGGTGPVSFPWGTVPRLKSRTYTIEEDKLGVVESALDRGFISAFEVLDAPAVSPAPKKVAEEVREEPVVEAPPVVAESPAEEPEPIPEPEEAPEEPEQEAAPEEKEEDAEEAHPLAELYEAVIGKPLTKKEPNRKELKKMYKSVFGEDPGKKYSTTVVQELVDATTS